MSDNIIDFETYKNKKNEANSQPLKLGDSIPEANSLQEVEERTKTVREKVGKIAEGMKALREAEQQNAENDARLKKMREEYNKRTKRDYRLKGKDD